jgi:hypothetical protein
VVINLQQTHLDEDSTVRVWARLDQAFAVLGRLLDVAPLHVPQTWRDLLAYGNVFKVPYDANGRLIPQEEQHDRPWLQLDLREGARVRVCVEEASTFDLEGTMVRMRSKEADYWYVKSARSSRLGWWWVSEALQGRLPRLPIINVDPTCA